MRVHHVTRSGNAAFASRCSDKKVIPEQLVLFIDLPFAATPIAVLLLAGPAVTVGSGLVSPTTMLPSDLPTTHWHTTARSWTPLNVPASSYLTRANNLTSWWAQNTNNSDGCMDEDTYNPFDAARGVHLPTSEAEGGILGFSVGVQNSLGVTTNRAKGILSMNCDTASYHSSVSGGDFAIGLADHAIVLMASFAGASDVNNWKSNMNFIESGIPGNTNNWVTYDMWGFWVANSINGFSAFNNATNTIEGWWTGNNGNGTNQGARMSDQPWNLYQDLTGVPDSLSVERVGGGNILNLLADGYNGPSSSAMSTASQNAAMTDLLMAAADGSNPAGGRQTDQNWVDSGQQLTFDTMAQRVGSNNPFLAGQFQRAAMMSFNSVRNYLIPSSACCNGLVYFPVKNHFDPSLGIGEQAQNGGATAWDDMQYNGSIQFQEFQSYRQRVLSSVAEQPTPVEIGGYAFSLPSDWSQAFVDAGGTAVQLALTGATSQSNHQYWTVPGINRIGRVGWENRLGPMDGSWAYLGSGANFGPTWITSGTSWTRLAQNPATCSGNFSTTFANPAVTFAQVVWSCGNISFTQNLTVTPDGVLSQTTCSGCTSTWGMTFPMLVDDGTTSPNNFGATVTTTSIGGNAAGIVQSMWPNGDQQNYMLISHNSYFLTAESNVVTSFGDITPVRAWSGTGTSTPDASQVTFVYPRHSSDPLASAVQAGMNITGTNTYTNSALNSSVVSGGNGTYYIGTTAAGGWAQTVTLPGGTLSFNTPCQFIAQLNASGQVTALEVDRSVTATVPGTTPHTGLAFSAYAPQTNL